MARLINQPMAANLTARTYTKLNIADNEREIRNKEYGMQTLYRRKCSLALVKISTAMSIDSIMQRTIQLLLSIVAVDHCCRLLFCCGPLLDFSCRLLLLICAVDFCAVKFYYRPLEWRDVMLPSEWRLLMKLEVVSAVWFYAEWYLGPKQCVIYVCFAELTRDNQAWRERGRCCPKCRIPERHSC